MQPVAHTSSVSPLGSLTGSPSGSPSGPSASPGNASGSGGPIVPLQSRVQEDEPDDDDDCGIHFGHRDLPMATPSSASSLLEAPLVVRGIGGQPSARIFRVATNSSGISAKAIAGGGSGAGSRSGRYHSTLRRLRRRAVLKNGDCNVLQSRISKMKLRYLQDIFTTLVDVQWRWTLLVFSLSFFLSWLTFALIWWLIAFTHGDLEPDHLPDQQEKSNWRPCVANIADFGSCFLFSVETQHTIGYGGRATTEECPEAIFVMCLQSICGVMIQAFMTGIVFSKLTRPKNRTQTLLFSRHAVICLRDGQLCLMFRVGDMRKSHIVGASIRAQLIRTKTTKEGETLSPYQHELKLSADDCDADLFFIWPTTIVHRIDSASPLWNMSAVDMMHEKFEIVVILEGTIETTSQTTQARSSYLPVEVLWGHRFVPIVNYNRERHGYEVDYSIFHNSTPVDTPLCSARELVMYQSAGGLLLAQTTCNQGIGRVVYERLPDQQLQGFDDDVVRDTSPPWEVLSKCQDLCLKDRTSSNNLVRVCSSFDFLPGARLTSFGSSAAYEESKCYLTREQAQPEGIGTLALVPKSVHFTEVCLSSSRVETECPQRRYVFERHPRKALRLETPDFKEVRAANRSDCEDKCLNEYGFTCRSATYDSTAMTCSMSRFTRRTHPQFFMDSPNTDYLENTCLNGERRCDATAIFVKEETKRLAGPWEAASLANTSLEDCQAECVSGSADKFFCRAIHYDENTRVCSLLEEDSFSQGEPQASASPTHHLYDLICLDNAHPFRAENSPTSHLFSHGRRPDTAFQRYRNSRLGGDFHSEITGQSLSECLDECLRQTSFACRSAVYSERFRNCRLSRFSQKDGHRVIYDADYDYYENLMAHYPENDPAPGYRPDPLGQDSQYPSGRPPYSPTGGLGTNQVGIYSSPGPYGSPHVGTVGHGANAIGYHVDAYGQPLAPVGPAGPGLAGVAPGLLPTYTPNPYLYGHNGLNPAGYGPGPHPQGPGALPGPGGYNDPFYGSASRPEVSRCEEGDSFRQVGSRVRARRPYVRKFVIAPTVANCERECSDARDFMCRSFNFRPYSAGFGGAERENCELSDRDSRQLDVSSPTYFENSPDFDFYERFNGRAANQAECLDVSQVCSEDGMVFTLRTPDRFFGRIYTHGYYDRCFFRGNGGFVSVFRINGAKGFPDCGTQRYGDTMTNIVVVQFSDFVQTGRDKRYNLTCIFREPGEAVVTSSYIGSARSGALIPIEYLPAENSLTSRVELTILYQGRPTTTIAVGDPLTFRLEAHGGFNTATDIFATNVLARDPYSGRTVQLIDQYGCPVDNYVFPALDRSREGDGLEARFNAFKIPESNFLVFEATVRTCRDGCQPAYCNALSGSGRSEPSFGRRRRRGIPDAAIEGPSDNDTHDPETAHVVQEKKATSNKAEGATEDEEQVREMFEVYESRFDMPEGSSGRSASEEKSADVARLEALLESGDVVLSGAEFYALVTSLALLLLLLLCGSIAVGLAYRRYRPLLLKHTDDRSAESACSQEKPSFPKLSGLSAFISNKTSISRSGGLTPAVAAAVAAAALPTISDNSIAGSHSHSGRRGIFEDPSEPIYTDPSLFERPRSMRSLAPSTTGLTSVEY